MGTGAVSRSRLSRSQKSVTVQDLNGPAIKLVGVAERLKVVTTKALLLRAGSRHTTGMSEAWRIFCQSKYNFFEFYECRGTNFIASRTQVTVHEVL
jgi:hypothetical protein